MAKLNVIDQMGKKVDAVELPDKMFNTEINLQVMRESLNHYLANQRQGTASTKTRGEVRGGGRKPWRQKGTGRARHGSIRSPIWRGGGITFGPKPRDYSYKLNKKKKRQALCSALSSLFKEGRIKIIKDISIKQPKTKQLLQILRQLGIEGKVLIMLDRVNHNAVLAARNIPGVAVSLVDNINIFDILYYDNLIITPGTVKKLEETLG